MKNLVWGLKSKKIEGCEYMKEKVDLKSEEYISEIDDVIEECKYVNFIATITKIQKIELKKAIVVGLNLKDDSGTIIGIFITPKNNNDAILKIKSFEIDKKYKINGDIIIVDNQSLNEFEVDKLIFKKFNVKAGDKTLAIRTIEEIGEK